MEDIIINDDTLVPAAPVELTGVETVSETPIPENTYIEEFFGTIQESITISWRYHLKTNKYRVHNALNEYYTKAIDIVDEIIEHYQGSNSTIIENYVNVIYDTGKTEVEYMNELKQYIVDKKDTMVWSSELASDIDNLLGIIDSTIYKLTSFTEKAIKSFDEFCFEDYKTTGEEGGVDGEFDKVKKVNGNPTSAGAEGGAEGGVDGEFDTAKKSNGNPTTAGAELGAEGGVDGEFDTTKKSNGNPTSAGTELGEEGGVDGEFDTVKKVNGNPTSAGTELGEEGGVDGEFDTAKKSSGNPTTAGTELGAEGGVDGEFDKKKV